MQFSRKLLGKRVRRDINIKSVTLNSQSVGGVAQWLGRRSVAGGRSLIYAWSMVDVWPLRG